MNYQILYNLDQQYTAALEPTEAALQLNSMTAEVARETISGDDLLEALDLAEATALGDAGQRALWGLIAKDVLSIVLGSNTRTVLINLFPAGSNTRSNLIDLAEAPLVVGLLNSVGLEPATAHMVATARERYGG